LPPYLKGYADGREAKAGIALGYRTPMAVWRERMPAAKVATTTCPSVFLN